MTCLKIPKIALVSWVIVVSSLKKLFKQWCPGRNKQTWSQHWIMKEIVWVSQILPLIVCKIKNHAHVKKVRHNSEFLPAIYWWTWKTTTYKCTINDHHMVHGFWDIEHKRQNFLSFWTIFCFFYPSKILLNPSKILLNHNFLKMEKRLGYTIILQMCTIYDSCMKYGLYEVWDMECNRQNFLLF